MKRPLALVAMLYVAGVLLGDLFPLRLFWLFVLSFAVAAAALTWTAARVYPLYLLVVLTGWTNVAARTAVLSPVDLRTLAGTNVAYVTLRGMLCETPGQRVYEHRGQESWHTLARLEVSAR